MTRTSAEWTAPPSGAVASRMVIGGDVAAIVVAGDGGAATLVGHVPGTDLPRWQTPLPEVIASSALAAPQVGASPDGATLYVAQHSTVAAVASADGAVRWSRSVPEVEPFESYSIEHPIVADRARLYLLSRYRRVIAVDAATGALAWRVDEVEPARALVLEAGVVITRSAERDELRAYDAVTGAPRWQRALTPAPQSLVHESAWAVQTASHRDGLALVVDGDRTVIAIEVATGATRWEEPIVAPATWAWAGSRLVLADAASVRAIDPVAGTVVWRHPTGGAARVAAIDAEVVALALPSAVAVVEVATGAIREIARHRLHDDDRVVAIGDGGAVITADGTACWYVRGGSGLRERAIGDPSLVQIELVAGGALTLDRGGTLRRFVR